MPVVMLAKIDQPLTGSPFIGRYFSAEDRPAHIAEPHVARPVHAIPPASLPLQQWRPNEVARAYQHVAAPPQRFLGVVEKVKAENGYGFIKVYDLDMSVFYHVNQVRFVRPLVPPLCAASVTRLVLSLPTASRSASTAGGGRRGGVSA